MPSTLRIAAATLPPGERLCLEHQGRPLTVLNVAGAYHAVENNCPHRGGPVGEGEVEGSILTCPWHGWSFDLRSGHCTSNPAALLTTFACRVDGDDVVVDVS